MSDEFEQDDAEFEEGPTFKSLVHRVINDGQNARREASRNYADTRERLIEQAKAAGSKDPERDAGRLHAMMLRDIDKKVHRDVQGIFEKHGWSRDRSEVAFEAPERQQERDFKETRREQAQEARRETSREQQPRERSRDRRG